MRTHPIRQLYDYAHIVNHFLSDRRKAVNTEVRNQMFPDWYPLV